MSSLFWSFSVAACDFGDFQICSGLQLSCAFGSFHLWMSEFESWTIETVAGTPIDSNQA